MVRGGEAAAAFSQILCSYKMPRGEREAEHCGLHVVISDGESSDRRGAGERTTLVAI